MMQAAENLLLFGGGCEIMVGQDDAYLVSVGQAIVSRIISSPEKSSKSTRCTWPEQMACSAGSGTPAGERTDDRPPVGTEGKEQWNVFQGRLQAGKDLVQGIRLPVWNQPSPLSIQLYPLAAP